jgi:hypothetical protein
VQSLSASATISGSSTASAVQNIPPSRVTKRRLRAAYTATSGSSSEIATARPGGRPRPDSRQVMPASWEIASGGFVSITAITVEPDAAAATSRGRLSTGCATRSGRSADGKTSSVSRSTPKVPPTVTTTAIIV